MLNKCNLYISIRLTNSVIINKVRDMELFADYHTHTSHGKGTVLDNVARANGSASRRLPSVTMAGHMFGIGIRIWLP